MTEYNLNYQQDLFDNRSRQRDDYYRSRGYDNYSRDRYTIFGELPERERDYSDFEYHMREMHESRMLTLQRRQTYLDGFARPRVDPRAVLIESFSIQDYFN